MSSICTLPTKCEGCQFRLQCFLAEYMILGQCMYCYSVTLLLKWQQNCSAIILYVYCVQHWRCASYSPASNPLWGGVLFLCKRVATFPFVGIRITHLNTWPFDRTRDGLTSKYSTVRTCVGPRLSKLSYCNDCIWTTYDWNYDGLTIRKWNCFRWYTAGNARDTLQYSGWKTIIAMSQLITI